MKKITIKEYRKYKEIIERLEQELERYPLAEEFNTEAGLEIGDREIYDFLKDEFSIDPDPNSYELILRRSISNNELKKARIKRNMTQAELGKAIGVSSITVSQWESLRGFPSDYQQQKIEKILKVSSYYLFPEWLRVMTQEIKNAEKEKVVEIGMISLAGKEQFLLEDGISEEKISNKILGAKVVEAMQNILTPREAKIINIRFGFSDGEPHTLEEVAREFGVTRDRIRQIEAKALEKIKDLNIIKNQKNEQN